jgi:hypothetical protein
MHTCTHRVWDRGRYVSRDCGQPASPESQPPRCRRHSPEAIERKRQDVARRVAERVAAVLARTHHITHPDSQPSTHACARYGHDWRGPNGPISPDASCARCSVASHAIDSQPSTPTEPAP